ncbi:MAG: hypothetical protein M1819_002722 [Sarea resinae]|nr:MAG: hypothetical protein M1819_002722 [Sarea resinae]
MAAPLSGRKRIFSSVFHTEPLTSTTPTPIATPQQAFTTPGQSFGGPQLGRQSYNENSSGSGIAAQQLRWDRAWHTATTFLSPPDEQLILTQAQLENPRLRVKWIKSPSPEDTEAFRYLCRQDHSSSSLSDLLGWYTNKIRKHFLAYVLPGLLLKLNSAAGETSLHRILESLKVAQAIYFYPLFEQICPVLSKASQDETVLKFRRDLHAVVAYSLRRSSLSDLLASVLTEEGRIILGVGTEDLEMEESHNEDGGDRRMSLDGPSEHTSTVVATEAMRVERSRGSGDHLDENEDSVVRAARTRILSLMSGLKEVGLGVEQGQRVFAEVMDLLMSDHVKSAFAGQWESPSTVPTRLRAWIENCFANLVVEVLDCLNPGKSVSTTDPEVKAEAESQPGTEIGLTDIEKWQEMGIGRLGRLRVQELFDVIVDWDTSMGAIEDLKHYVTTPLTRSYLTTCFANVLSQRLLQPGASTIEILQVYISLIRAFTMLDPKGVLLDRVARPIRRYLRDRDDTVKVIVAGMLADTEDENGEPILRSGEVLVELAVELNRATELASQGDDDGDLDWDDMHWVPDPVDAGPEYKKSKTSDVMGSLISLFESKDVFVKEFQNIMGERLLKKDFSFDKEIRVLELLKLRFGEGALQACEVMLRDVIDSKRVDSVIRSDQNINFENIMPDTDNTPSPPHLHAKILSRLFWPALHEESFSVPLEIAHLQHQYAKGFEALKPSRKLTWLNALGQVTVELDLEDRIVTEEAQTWQATVINAFQDLDDNVEDGGIESVVPLPTTKTVAELVDQLEMDETLVRKALTFWVSRYVLKETGPDTYAVLETLDDVDDADPSSSHMPSDTAQAAAAAAAATAEASAEDAGLSSVRSAQDIATENMQLYWQFIIGMLTNQGAMPLPRIVTVLKFAVPGGFPFSEEELREFLEGMVHQGKIALSGGNYKLVQ